MTSVEGLLRLTTESDNVQWPGPIDSCRLGSTVPDLTVSSGGEDPGPFPEGIIPPKLGAPVDPILQMRDTMLGVAFRRSLRRSGFFDCAGARSYNGWRGLVQAHRTAANRALMG